jgi:FMN-dependent NADH-azoreductase
MPSPHLLHIDSSIQGDRSISRRLTARAAQRWRDAHPGGTVAYRDLGLHPIPHVDATSAPARMLPADQHTPQQAASWALTEELVGEIRAADTIVMGLPLYNFGPPSTVKAWVDHLIAPGLSIDPVTREGLLGGRDFLILATRGGGYGEGTPREGWDHASPWLPHGISLTGLEPRFITAELTLAAVNPAMADLVPMMEASLADAERAVDEQWRTASAM